MVSIERITYHGWSEAYHLTNGQLELIVPQQIGIRIMHCGLVRQANHFHVNEALGGQSGGPDWYLYGGHRLWHAPESKPRTYYPDNHPIEVIQQGESILLRQATEPTTGIQKEIELTFHPSQAQVKVVHRLRNHNLWAVELAPWALSVMKAGGVGIIPLPPYGSHDSNLLPNRQVILWPYSRMTDPRWTWGDHFIMLRQDANATNPQKVGMDVAAGWAAYANDGQLFLKTFQPIPNASYPDRGSSVEFFTNKIMLEVETLGPLQRIEPQASIEHQETWFVFGETPTPDGEADVEAHILPKAQLALASQ
jgi:hypothetical protein